MANLPPDRGLSAPDHCPTSPLSCPRKCPRFDQKMSLTVHWPNTDHLGILDVFLAGGQTICPPRLRGRASHVSVWLSEPACGGCCSPAPCLLSSPH